MSSCSPAVRVVAVGFLVALSTILLSPAAQAQVGPDLSVTKVDGTILVY